MSFDEQPDAPLHGECAAEIARLEQQRDELAAQVEVMRGLLAVWGRPRYGTIGSRDDEVTAQQKAFDEALALPNTAADILRQRDARTLRKMAERLCDYYATGGAAVDAVRIIRKAANEVENVNA